jgi:cytidylate kinase
MGAELMHRPSSLKETAMSHSTHLEDLPLARALVHAESYGRPSPGRSGPTVTPLNIAISRETGSGATAIAHELGRRLEWPVYDHELLERMSQDLKVNVELLESIDERHVGWIQESVEALSLPAMVSEGTYVRRLVETLFTLAASGRCILVGRGAAMILPESSTLRVRLVAPLEDRMRTMGRLLGVNRAEAARLVKSKDRERDRFVRDHFQRDTTDPRRYHMVLNTSRFTPDECVDQIELALRQLANRIEKV